MSPALSALPHALRLFTVPLCALIFPSEPIAMAADPAAARTAPPSTKPAARPASGAPAARALEVAAAPGGDEIELRAGARVLARLKLATPALRRGAPALSDTLVEGHRIVEVRVPIRGRPAEEVWIGDLGAGAGATASPPRAIWSGIAGPRDSDEETSLFVEVTPDRIVEYQSAAHVTRCDGEAVQLLPRAWDFAKGRFRSIVSGLPDVSAQKLTARRDDPAMPAGRSLGGFHFTAASTTAAAGGDARGLLAPAGLDDGDPKTAWAEGLGGDGRGEFLTARASGGPLPVRGLRIIPGDASTPAAWKARNRLKTLALALGPEPDRRFEVAFPDDPAAAEGKARVAYWVPLPAPVTTACLTVVIREVYRGGESGPAGGGGTTAIAEMEIFTEADDPAGVDRLVASVASGADCPSRVPLLVALGEPAVLPAAQTILGASGLGRECLVDALSRIDATVKSGVALDALAAALIGASANEEQLIARTLQKAPAPPVHAVAEVLRGPRSTPEDRGRAARVLGALETPDAPAALLAALEGAGPEARLAIIQALGQARLVTAPLVLAELAKARAGGDAAAGAREGDLLSVLAALARRPTAAADRPAAIEAIRRSLASGRSFEVQGRAVLALGTIGDTATAGDLAAVRARSKDEVLRFLAARELGALGGPEALAALRAALADGDPRVREAAAHGLGLQRDLPAEPLLIKAAKEEPWPFARRAEIEALSRTCGTPARDLLMRAMERDVDEVRRAALVGLVRCKDPRASRTLVTTLKAVHASAPLRELAASLLAEVAGASAAVSRTLAELVPGLVNEAEADLAIEGVVVAAIRSLGRLGGPDAAGTTARLALDEHHPYRHHAVDALGEICDADTGAKTLAVLRAGKDAALAAAAQAAQNHCRAGKQ